MNQRMLNPGDQGLVDGKLVTVMTIFPTHLEVVRKGDNRQMATTIESFQPITKPAVVPKKPGETLRYMRPAKKRTDGAEGELYIQHWPTGWDELVFASHEKAKSWCEARGVEYFPPMGGVK